MPFPWPTSFIAVIFGIAICPAQLLLAAEPPAAGGAETDRALLYAHCMALARHDPVRARAEAETWRKAGGGNAGTHCLAVALMGLGRYQESARVFESLARSLETGKDGKEMLRGDILGQAAHAWLLADAPERALSAQSRAIEIMPGDVELLIDRSITLASITKLWKAIDDLNRALEISPGRADALIFRASAYRQLESLELAQEDIDRAMARAPNHPDGLLERGIIRRLKGDAAGAQADWQRAIEVAPGSPAADAARRNIEKLAVKTD